MQELTRRQTVAPHQHGTQQKQQAHPAQQEKAPPVGPPGHQLLHGSVPRRIGDDVIGAGLGIIVHRTPLFQILAAGEALLLPEPLRMASSSRGRLAFICRRSPSSSASHQPSENTENANSSRQITTGISMVLAAARGIL